MGKIYWGDFVEGLAEIRFRGALSFETFAVMQRVPPRLAPAALRYIAEIGRAFAAMVEEKEQELQKERQ